MARLPDPEIERLKRDISLERLVEAHGIELKRHGENLRGLCPFHDDHDPSLIITPKKNVWHCMGACTKRGGSVIDWVMQTRGVSFRHACELLRQEHPALAAPLPRVVKRGTTDGYRLPDKNRKSGAEIRGRLQRLGILRESGHEHFNGSVVIPILDLSGNVTGMYGRKITPGLREGTPLHLYLPGPHQGVWNEEALAVSKEIILCEALIDALTFWCADYRNVTASYGVNGFTNDHREAFKRHGTKKVLIAYDRDAAGEQAALALAEELIAMGIDCYRVLFPKGMDANAYGSKVKPATRSLAVLLHKTEWLGKGKPPVVTVPERMEEEPPIGPQPLTKPEPSLLIVEEAAAKEEKPITEESLPLAAEPIALLEPAPAAIAPEILPPPNAGVEVPVQIRGDEITTWQGDRKYRVRGLAKNLSYELMRVNVLVARGEAFHVDTLDLYSARQRGVFTKQTAEELKVKEDIIKRELGRVMLKLEELQDDMIRKALEPEDETVKLAPEEKATALELLQDPKLLDRILTDFERCGVVGEETNKLVGYLAAVSRRLESPLAIVVQSSSAAGKSSLMDAVLAFVPEEDRAQTQAIHRQQREQQTLDGLLRKKQREEILRLHQNAQRLLRPLFVANPYARSLTFMDSQTRTRRDHVKYLMLIRSIALLHQYQREIQTTRWNDTAVEYIEVTLDDIATANRLVSEVLGRSLDDLPPQTRRLLLLIDQFVAEQCQQLKMERSDYRFSRRDVRQYTGWGNTQLKLHLGRLEDMEYLVIHHGGRGRSLVYEIAFECTGEDHKPKLAGLIDVERLRYDENRPMSNAGKSGSSRLQVGGMSGGGRDKAKPITTGIPDGFRANPKKNTDTGGREESVAVVAAGGR